ncbi:MAG: DUF3857 and transglutaminase domain-containing protein [Acidobacteriia bacterium]|nr:DUF3857 and transglutaminase domain-containing protein [Terriglobia bacterium]
MPRALRLPAILLAVALFNPRSLSALDDWPAIQQEELKMTANPAHPTDAIILNHEETFDDNRRHQIVYMRIKIFTEKGREWGDVEIPYLGTTFHLTDVKGRTIAPDGSITPYTGKVFDKTIVRGQGVKLQAKAFALPNVQPGCIVEFKYTEYWDAGVYAPRWIVQEKLPQKRALFTFIPYSGSRDVVDKRGNTGRVFFTTVGLPSGAAIKSINDRQLQLELKDIPAFEEEELAPPSAMLKWRVNFYYGTDKMAKPAEFWKEEGKYWTKEVEKFTGHSTAVAAAANQLVSPSDTPDQKLRKIYAGVQKMKNLSYEDATRREEGLERLRTEKRTQEQITAEDVLKNNEGKRDELTRLFVAMVRSVNLPAYVARVTSRDETFFQQNLPDWRQLDSEVAVVQGPDGKELFLDPGTPACPFGLLDWRHTAVQGVRQTADGGTEFATTPPPDYTKTLTLRTAALTLTSNGDASGIANLSWTGQEALARRIRAARTDEAGRKKELEDELRALLPNGAEVQMESSTGWDSPETALTAKFKVQVPALAGVTGKRLIVPSGVFESKKHSTFTHADRKAAVYLSYPYRVVDDVQISLPPDYKVEDLPRTQPIQTDFAIFKFERTSTGNSIHFRRDFAIANMAFPVQAYPELRTLFGGVSAGDSQQVVLTAAK